MKKMSGNDQMVSPLTPGIIGIIKRRIAPHFNEKFYKEQWEGVDWSAVDPLQHYIEFGWKSGRCPNADFSVASYLATHSIKAELIPEPLYHSLTNVASEQILTSSKDAGKFEDLSILTRELLSFFDSDFYLLQQRGADIFGMEPVQHYYKYGWKNNIDPNPDFSVSQYLENNPDVKKSGVEPMSHWIRTGRKEGLAIYSSLYPATQYTQIEKAVAEHFDVVYYLKTYPDVKLLKHNPLVHYMRIGWREGRNPNEKFKTIDYLINNPDVITSGEHPFYHYVSRGLYNGPTFDEIKTIKRYLGPKLMHAYQDISFPKKLEECKKLMVFILPEHNEMSGGIYSIFSIASIVKRQRHKHQYEVVLMTRPNALDHTYCRQRHFRNNEDVFRFQQIERCRNVEELYIHIPEYAAPFFVNHLEKATLTFLRAVSHLYINILNQNIELMPESNEFEDLRSLSTDHLSQSVAHHAYFSQEYADRYNLLTLLLPAYTDLSGYSPTKASEKQDIIIYSPDDAPHKRACLDLINNNFPNYKLIEIRNITFEDFMELATVCKFSISFGEGFDGYVAQPMYQGGLGLTIFKSEFFPDRSFLDHDVFFENSDAMLRNVCDVIDRYSRDHESYNALNRELIRKYDSLYCFDDYIAKINKLVGRQFDIRPGNADITEHVHAFRFGAASNSLS